MKIKDVIEIAAVLSGKDEVSEYLEKGACANDEIALKEISVMTRCANVILDEISSEYFPFVKTESVAPENGRINYSGLDENALEIRNVFDADGKEVKFRAYTDYAFVSGAAASVEYAFAPSSLDLNDEITGLNQKVTARILAYGASGEYALAEGRYEEGVMWNDRYKTALTKLFYPKSVNPKYRRFI